MATQKELVGLLEKVAGELGMTLAENGGAKSAWAKPKPEGEEVPFLGVSVPLKMRTPRGDIRVYLSLPPEVASSPESLVAAVGRLVEMGLPVDIFSQDRGPGWGGGGGNWGGGNQGWQGRGGYGGNGGYWRGRGGW